MTAVSLPFGIYQYTYGAGNAPNRKIEFFEAEEKISATISAQSNKTWKKISQLTEKKMFKEGMSISEKVKLMMKAREEGLSPTYPPDIDFPSLSMEEKKDLIENLQPTGSWHLTIQNSIGENPYFEQVSLLHFFDGSLDDQSF